MMRHRKTLRFITSLTLSLLLSYMLKASEAWQYQSSKSFMFTRPLNHLIVNEFMWDEVIACKSKDNHAAFRIVPMYQKSRDDCSPAGYFLLDCQRTILVAGDNTAQKCDRNVRAEWLGLPSTFAGLLSLAPTQRQVGAVLNYNQDIGHILNFSWLNRVWFTCSLPIISVEQNLHPSEFIFTQGEATTAYPRTILEAINNPNYYWGRIDNCTRSKTAPTELDLGFGTSWTCKNDFLLWYQTTLDIPLSGRTNPDELFRPVLGNNGHVVWTNEFAAALPLHPEDSDFTCKLMVNIANHYYFSHNQHRVLDLFKKPWSRYLPLRNKCNPNLIVPAINVLTQWVRIHPFNIVNFATGIRIGGCGGWVGEIGYALWAHRGEKAQFLTKGCNTRHPNYTQFGIQDPNSSTGTASKSTITTVADADEEFVTINQNDINLYSGTSQDALTQSAHFEVGYRTDWIWGALGAYVEEPHTNTALALWGAWGTLGFEF